MLCAEFEGVTDGNVPGADYCFWDCSNMDCPALGAPDTNNPVQCVRGFPSGEDSIDICIQSSEP